MFQKRKNTTKVIIWIESIQENSRAYLFLPC